MVINFTYLQIHYVQYQQSSSQSIRYRMRPQQQNLFHKFVLYADKLPKQAKFFPCFQFMSNSIRKSFHQLKKIDHKKIESIQQLQKFWNHLHNQDRVNLYCKWVDILHMALKLQQNPSFKFPRESVTIQDQIYMKSSNTFSKWDHKIVKLTSTHLLVKSKKSNKQYQLKDYEFSNFLGKNKQLDYAWILQPIDKSDVTLFFSVKSEQMYKQWFYALIYNIDNARTMYFCKCIQMQRENPGSSKQIQLKRKRSPKKMKKIKSKKSETQIKTLTQIVIDNQMKDLNSDGQQGQNQISIKQNLSQEDQMNAEINYRQNPNIFQRLLPEYQSSLLNFTQILPSYPLIQLMPSYKILQIPQQTQNQHNISILKMFITLPYPKSLIFKVLTSEAQQKKWNSDIQMINIKTKIGSENSVLYYEKNKSQGLLYRQRDFLYLRHCFSITNMKHKNTFIVDKSIDSIHLPPFMTVVRAQKQIICGLFQKQGNPNCCQIVVEGWIQGGGYMNMLQNREMTMRHFKKILNLGEHLKSIKQKEQQKNFIVNFKQKWEVYFDEEEQEQEQFENQQQSSGEQGQINQQMVQFFEKTKEQNMSYPSSQKHSQINCSQNKFQNYSYNPPSINQQTQQVIIPYQYLNITHITNPKQKCKKPKLAPHVNGHHLYKGQWELSNKGGLKYIDQEKMRQQKKVLTYIIKRIGKNIFSGKGILNVSLPVDIFCVQSNIQRLAMSMGFFPHYLQIAAKIQQPQNQLRYILGAGIASSLIYMTVEKPFNPILGQTFQCLIDDCPLYFQQISHHPPIAAFLMIGRGYKVSGNVEAKMQLSINSGTGNNQGIFTIQFDNGNTFYFTTPSGCISGVTYGQRKLNMVGKCYYWSKQGLFLQITYNPAASRKSFFGGNKSQGDEGLCDFIQGQLKKFSEEDLMDIAFKKDQNGSIKPIIPKKSPKDAIKTYYKIQGRWNNYLKCQNQVIFNADETRYYSLTEQPNPLPSNSNYREDIVYRRLRNFVLSQQFKQKLEIKQRNDRKLRAKFTKQK